MAESRAIDVYAVSQGAGTGALAAARAMPVFVLDVIVLATIVETAQRIVFGQAELSAWLMASIELVMNVLVLAPLTFATYRFALLGEVGSSLTKAWAHPAFAAFLKGSLLVSALSLGLYFSGALLGAMLPQPFATTVFLAAFAASVALSVRLALYFPALATAAPGARLFRAFADSAGHGWKVFLVLAVCSAPFLFVGLALEGAAREVEPMRPVGLILAGLRSAVDVGWTLVLALAAAGLYRILADKLLKAPVEPRS
ncbi:MAG: hypothetical protein EA385_08745 [Salinarimonadaceae bacterium]|nr:MAG: hypothetical protein EA385_08745 [Salinarimonadaceae bacterium]